MLFEGELIFLAAFVETDFSVETSLLPKAGDRASDLHMREALSLQEDYLLSFTEVGHVSLVVDAS